MRTAILALILLCCTPRSHPVILGVTPAFLFVAALGITNGLSASLSMMLAPVKVAAPLKEATGNVVTLAYNIGLAMGMGISFVFDNMRGPQMIHPCPHAEGLSMNASTEIIQTTLLPPTNWMNDKTERQTEKENTHTHNWCSNLWLTHNIDSNARVASKIADKCSYILNYFEWIS